MARQLAKLIRIDAIRPILKADAIECARVGGWSVVVKKGAFQPGDEAAYFEIDAFLPQGNPAWQFLIDKQPLEHEGRLGHALRSVRLRGQISQGLLLSFPELGIDPALAREPGFDLAARLDVTKYEKPIPAELDGIARGMYPSRVPKTDQERAQNLAMELLEWAQAGDAGRLTWEATEKLEGASTTFAMIDSELHVCSRGVDFIEAPGNALWAMAHELKISERLSALYPGRQLALQGELIGPGIEENVYELDKPRFYLYDIHDIDAGRKLPPTERRAMAQALGLDHAPLIDPALVIGSNLPMDALLERANGVSAINPAKRREGEVYKCEQEELSFKAISNDYLVLGARLAPTPKAPKPKR